MAEAKEKSQLKSGIVLSYISIAVHNIVGIVYTPVMIRLLGQSEYGLYNLAASVIAYLGLLGFGFDSTYLRYYSQYRHVASREKIASLNAMFLLVFTGIGIVALIAGVVLSQHTHMLFGEKLAKAELATASRLMLLLAINIGIVFPGNVFSIYINANEKFAVAKLVSLTQMIVNPFIVLPLLLMGYKAAALVSVTLFYSVVINAFNIIYCVRKLDFRLRFKKFEFRLFKGVASFSFWVFLGQIVDEINWYLDKFLLGRYCGTIAVAIYGVGANLAAYLRSFSSSISSVFAPRVNRIEALQEGNTILTDLMIKVGRIQFIALSLVVSGFAFLGQMFCTLWVGSDYRNSYYIALILMIPSIIPLIQNIGVTILMAKNKHKIRNVIYFFIACLNVAISIPLCIRYEGIGCAIGTAVSLIVGNGIFINLYYRYIGLDILRFWKEILQLGRGLVIPILCGIWIMYLHLTYSWLVFLAAACGYAAVFGISMYCLGMNEYECGLVTGCIHKLKRRFSKRS